ncbi:fungal-specific transcription factor domain-containing protein [Paraphoma chrysanthemicola]|uniref:Fungal-specific transcription factor domain-containing protein n=1 Tax=Paraphoma chrysanthemicola TaxID=798071 RepID=A0A8K0VYC3_9PLEO|nr:fungal-specific transcription factor domain-containing protein [Paraphoma chrysanthemicola]
MDADRRLSKALEAANDALQHLSMSPDFNCLDCTHIDRLLGRVVDLPTEGNQRNSRRNLLVIRQWMITEGPGVVLLEVLGQLYWRLGELNSKQFEKFKGDLQQQQPYLSLIQDTAAVTLVIQRIRHIQRSKADACQDFLCELSDLSGLKVDSPMAEMDALRADSTSPFTPQSVHSLDSNSSQDSAFVSLIKYVPSSSMWGGDIEQTLTDFYISGICPGRTVATQSNTYIALFEMANSCLSTRYALLSLSASYICEYLPAQKEAYHQAELYYSTQALKALTSQISNGQNYEGALATSMLLLHHAAINSEDSPLCWSCHANVFDTIPSDLANHHSETAFFIRAQLALSRTAQTAFQLQSAQFHSLETKNWYEGTPPTEAQKICGVLGFSPKLLFLISAITSLASDITSPNKLMYAQVQETQLQNLKQWTPELQSAEQDVLVATAEAFRLAALIYLRCRLYGFTRFHPSVLELSEALHTVIMSLPVKGSLYTAIYPIWPLFVAAVTASSDKRDRLYQRVVPIREGDKNTLPPVLKRVSGLRIWLANQDPSCQKRSGWWDEMLSPSSSTIALGSSLLCLG